MDVQVAMVTVPRDRCWHGSCSSGCSRDASRHGGEHDGALSVEHPVQGTHVSIVGMHRATFLLDPGQAECMRIRASAASLKHPPSSSTGMGRGWLEEVEKTGTEKSVCLNRLFLERAFSCLFMRG